MLRRRHALVSLFLAFGLISFIAPAVVFGGTTIIIARTDFGNSGPTDIVSPFSTSYTYPADTINFGRYSVDITANNYGPLDWSGYDYTNPGTGAFMIVDGATDSGLSILSYSLSAVAGYTYTFSGYFRPFQIGTDSDNGVDEWAILSFRVNGVEKGKYWENTSLDWYPFSFNYTATENGPITLSLNDNNVNGAYNDFGLDNINLSSARVPEPSLTLLLFIGLGAVTLVGWRFKS